MLLLMWLKFICFFPVQRPWHFPVIKHEAHTDLSLALFLFFRAMVQSKHLPERNQWQSARPLVGSMEQGQDWSEGNNFNIHFLLKSAASF